MIEQNIEASDGWAVGENKDLVFDVGDTLEADGSVSGPVNLNGFSAIQWELRRGSAGDVLIVKRSGEEIDGEPGVEQIAIEDDPDAPALNQSRARVRVRSADTAALRGQTYAHVLRELDGGRILTRGRAVLLDAGLAADT